MRSILLLSVFTFSFLSSTYAQCGNGEVALTMNVNVDAWGQETYWELVPTGNDCGDGTIAFGSNTLVGCTGTPPANGDDGYPDNTTVFVGPICLSYGVSYDLIYVDSYGDGGLSFVLYDDSNFSHSYVGSGYGNTWTFVAGINGLPFNDSPCGATDVVPDGPAVEMTNNTAIAQLGEPQPPAGGCGTFGFWCGDGTVSNTVWARFVADENVAYEITTCNSGSAGFDTQLALYHATDCQNFSTFQLIAANDDMPGGCSVANGFSSRMHASCLIPGDTYYIQLDGWEGALGTAYLSVTTYTGAVTLNAQVNSINCPLQKGADPTGSITPYFAGTGSNFISTWTGPNGYTSENNTVNDLGPGSYTITAISSCGTSYTQTFQITQPAPWNVAITGVGPDCDSSSNGSITISAAGASMPFTYNWVGPNNFTGASNNLTSLNSGSYSVVVTDDNGCNWNQTYQLNSQNSFSFNLGNDTTICIYDQLIVTAPPGLTYEWQDASVNQFFIIQSNTWNLGAQALILTATTANGCSFTDAFVFNVDACAGVHEGEASAMTIYPNPSSDLIMVAFETVKNNIDVRIFDAAGRLVSDEHFMSGSNFVIGTDLPTGVYSLNVIADNEHWVKKLLVQ